MLLYANIKLRTNPYCTLGKDCSHVVVAILSPHLESCVQTLPFVRQHAAGSHCYLHLVQALHGELLQRPAISAYMFWVVSLVTHSYDGLHLQLYFDAFV